MIHFLHSTLEKKQSLSDQLISLELHAREIAKKNYPFKKFFYEIQLKGVRFPIYIHTSKSLSPVFYFIKKSIQCFFRCEHILTDGVCLKEQNAPISEAEVSDTGIIRHEGKIYWSMASAVFRGKVLKVAVVKLISGKHTLKLYDGDTYLGYAEEISNP